MGYGLVTEVYGCAMGSVQVAYGKHMVRLPDCMEVYGLDPECTVSVWMILQLIFLLHVITTYI